MWTTLCASVALYTFPLERRDQRFRSNLLAKHPICCVDRPTRVVSAISYGIGPSRVARRRVGPRNHSEVVWIASGDPGLTLSEQISTLVQSPIDVVPNVCCPGSEVGASRWDCSDADVVRRREHARVSPTSFGRHWTPTYSRSVDRGQGQADVPAEQPSSGARPRLPSPDADPRGSRHRVGASRQGPRQAHGLIHRYRYRRHDLFAVRSAPLHPLRARTPRCCLSRTGCIIVPISPGRCGTADESGDMILSCTYTSHPRSRRTV